jgi:hypothetical protein
VRKVLTILVLAGMAGTAGADVLVGWDFAEDAGNESAATSSYQAVGFNASTLTRGPGIQTSTSTNCFISQNWTVGGSFSDAMTSNAYVTWTVNSESGYEFAATNFSFRWSKNNAGPTSLTLRSSLDGFTSDLGTLTRTALGPFDEALPLGMAGLTSVTFRLYGYSAGDASGVVRLSDGGTLGAGGDLDAGVLGTITAVPEPGTFALLTAGLWLLRTWARRRRS